MQTRGHARCDCGNNSLVQHPPERHQQNRAAGGDGPYVCMCAHVRVNNKRQKAAGTHTHTYTMWTRALKLSALDTGRHGRHVRHVAVLLSAKLQTVWPPETSNFTAQYPCARHIDPACTRTRPTRAIQFAELRRCAPSHAVPFVCGLAGVRARATFMNCAQVWHSGFQQRTACPVSPVRWPFRTFAPAACFH